MKYLPFLLLLLPGPQASAQSPFFARYAEQDTMYWSSNVLFETANGDIVQMFRLLDGGFDTSHFVFRRSDASGTLLAEKRVSGAAFSLQMYDGTELPDGSLMLFGTDFPNAVTMRIDAMGNLISVLRCDANTSWYTSVLWMNDSTLLALGMDAPSGGHSLLLSRFDASGSHLGSVGVRMGEHGAFGIGAIRSSVGGILVCAQGEDSTGIGFTNAGRSWLLRLDELGNVQWARNYRDAAERLTYPVGMVEDNDGRIRIGGNLWSVGNYTHRFLLTLDANGDTLSMREYSNALDPMLRTSATGFVSPDASTLLFTGTTDGGPSVCTMDTSGVPLNSMRIDVATWLGTPRLSASGDLLIPAAGQPPTAFIAFGAWRTDDPFSMGCSTPVNIAMASISPVIQQDFVTQPVSMIFDDITSLLTSVPSQMSIYDPCLPNGLGPLPPDPDALRIWPVPATDRITVDGMTIDQVTVLDPLGRIVLSRPINGQGPFDLDIRSLASGVHVLSIQRSDGEHLMRTFIKQ